MYRNVGKELPLYAAQYPWTAQIELTFVCMALNTKRDQTHHNLRNPYTFPNLLSIPVLRDGGASCDIRLCQHH